MHVTHVSILELKGKYPPGILETVLVSRRDEAFFETSSNHSYSEI